MSNSGALLDPVVGALRARRLALRYRREAQSQRRRLLARWSDAPPRTAPLFLPERKPNSTEGRAPCPAPR